jgi:hypothetical protein
VKPTSLDIDNPTFPKQLLQGFEAELAAMEKAEAEAAAKKVRPAAAAVAGALPRSLPTRSGSLTCFLSTRSVNRKRKTPLPPLKHKLADKKSVFQPPSHVLIAYITGAISFALHPPFLICVQIALRLAIALLALAKNTR